LIVRRSDTWREIGILRDQLMVLHGEVARRDAELAAVRAALAERQTHVGRSLVRRVRARWDRWAHARR
jgi:hypothetical protein